MRKTPYKTWLLAGFLLLTPWVAHAAGLGKLTIVSALGQPLLAEVDLVSVQPGELATLTARLAPPEAFTKANIAYSPALVGVRMSIERRADGQAYIKIISTRPINEPFLDLLVELSWAQGRLVREYTALVDPVGYAPTVPAEPVAPAVPPVAVTPPVTTESQPITPAPQPPVAVATPVEAKPAVKALPVKPPAAAAAQTYGPVKRGDTLAKIASAVKPEGVTLEQMLVSLYHANPDAFAGNMNILKTDKILRVPDKKTTVATGHSGALKEVRVETANWNAYRQKLADAAGVTAAGPKSAASGKITTKVDDKAAGKAAPKEVLKLSKGEPAAGKAGDGKGKGAGRSVPNRIRMLEEEATAREKALAEANNRIAQLEKTIKDMQRVIEIKARPPVAKPAPQPPASEPDLLEQILDEPAYLAAGGGLLVLVLGYLFVRRRRAQAVDDEPTDEKVEPTAKKVEADVDKKTAAAGVGGVLALLSGYWYALRQRMQAGAGGVIREKTAPGLGTRRAVAGAAAAAPAALATSAAGGASDVDPLAEAEMYLNFGRDVQAEEVLIAALAKNPNHEEAQLKLLQVYAARKDKPAFEKIARTLHAQTSGVGGNWVKAAAMGYAFDPKNAMYEAGASAPAATTPVAGGVDPDLDFNFDLDAAPNAGVAKTDVKDVPVAATLPAISMPSGNLEGAAVTAPPAAPNMTFDVPVKESPATDIAGDSTAPMSNVIDFSFDAAAPAQAPVESADDSKGDTHDGTPGVSPAQPAPAPELSGDIEFSLGDKPEASPAAAVNSVADEVGAPMIKPDFRLDMGGSDAAVTLAPGFKFDDINLDLSDGPAAAGAPAGGDAKDDHWHDVQTKFDLARAYQEMGEKDGARGILQEVIKEGDGGQRAEAQKLLDSLG